MDVKVSACIPTRGDVNMEPILSSLPTEWEKIVYRNNGTGPRIDFGFGGQYQEIFKNFGETWPDLSVYGRYAAIEYASHDLIYVQDDDVIVSDPQAIVREWHRLSLCSPGPDGCEYDGEDPCYQCGARMYSAVCNMPPEFRHDFYSDHALVGFGAAFHRGAPKRAFERLASVVPTLGLSNYGWWLPGTEGNDHFLNTCDVAFTTLTPRVLVDVPKENLPHATGPDRMYRQPTHYAERQDMLKLALKVRNA